MAVHLDDAGSVQELITSIWREELQTKDQATQTLMAQKHNAANQASGMCFSVPTQTSALEWSGGGMIGDCNGSLLQQSVLSMADSVESALMENAAVASEMFLVPERFSEAEGDDLELAWTLHPPAGHDWNECQTPTGDRPGLGSLVCTSLSWNATGQVLAASYGRKDLVGWCEHPGALCSWNLGEEEECVCNPTTIIKLDNCLMCTAFHPQRPTIIAGGTFNGEVYLWDLSKDDPQIAVSGATHVSHSEPVTQVAWHYNKLIDNFLVPNNEKDTDNFQIISISTDGHVLVWSPSSLDRPIYGYELQQSGLLSLNPQRLGGTCIDFPANREDLTTFVVGTEGGAVCRCALSHNQQMLDEFARHAKNPDGRKAARRNLLSPIRAQFESHVGPVHSIKFSPFQKQLFATCGFDGFVCIYNTLQAKPIMRLEPSQKYILCTCWSPFRPLVIAIGGGDGQLFLYDFQKSILHPIFTVKANEKGHPISALAFNHRLPQYLACTAGKHVKVYQLGVNYSAERVLERKQLAHLARSGLEDL